MKSFGKDCYKCSRYIKGVSMSLAKLYGFIDLFMWVVDIQCLGGRLELKMSKFQTVPSKAKGVL